MIYDHSRNGTWVNGEHLHNASTILMPDNDIRFGSAPRTTWKVVELAPPQAVLVPLQGNQPAIELKQIHVLPDAENPEVCIFLADDHWSRETDHGVVALKDGEIITCDPYSWQYFSPQAADTTIGLNQYRHMTIDDILFSFQASLDEEHVEAIISQHDKEIKLQERVHHYLLLTLARQRLEDAKKGIDQDNQGWLDMGLLGKMLGLELNHINIQIFRARKQIADAMPEVFNLCQLVERRPGSIRFGLPYFKVFRGGTLEGEILKG